MIYQAALRGLPSGQLLPAVGGWPILMHKLFLLVLCFKAPLVLARENSLRIGLTPAAAHIWGAAA